MSRCGLCCPGNTGLSQSHMAAIFNLYGDGGDGGGGGGGGGGGDGIVVV